VIERGGEGRDVLTVVGGGERYGIVAILKSLTGDGATYRRIYPKK